MESASSGGVLTETDTRAIFLNVRAVRTLSAQLLAEFQQRVEPRSVPPPTVQRSQEGSTRQFTQQRNVPQRVEPSGSQSTQKKTRKREEDKIQLGP